MADEDDILAKMGINPSAFRVEADFNIGAVIVEIRDADGAVTKWCLTPQAADQLARALTTCRRRVLDKLLEDEG